VGRWTERDISAASAMTNRMSGNTTGYWSFTTILSVLIAART